MATELLHYSEAGNGQPLIILHGLFGSSKNWQSLARVLSRHFRVLTLDLRNHGSSFHHDEMNYPVMAEDVYRLMAHLQIDSCSVIGHSMTDPSLRRRGHGATGTLGVTVGSRCRWGRTPVTYLTHPHCPGYPGARNESSPSARTLGLVNSC